MTLLALETATTTCGAAVLEDDTVRAQAHLQRPRVHSAQLTPLIEDVLRHADVQVDHLDAVAVSMGPGSYTGLRIGVSTAKGWAMASEADLVGVSTLKAYAAQAQPWTAPGDVVCALLDARRDEVYAAAYRRTEDGWVPHADTTALSVNDLPEWCGTVEGQLWLVGDGGEKSHDALIGQAPSLRMLPPDLVTPSAAWVARCGRDRLAADGPDDRATLEPLYVKEVHATPSPSPFD